MANIAYVNGSFIEQNKASLPILDRSIVFSDAVYEVVCVWDYKFLDYAGHIERLQTSLQKLNILYALDKERLFNDAKKLVQENKLQYGILYLQVTRGCALRDFVIAPDMQANIFMFVAPKKLETLEELTMLKLQSYPDKRWGLCDIKTTQLLYASLAKSEAKKNGKDDVVFIKDGFITEASSANFYIIDKTQKLITRPLDGTILPGITRALLLKIAKQMGIEIVERKFSLEEAQNAEEAFISSASSFVHAVVKLDDKLIGSGEFGPISKKLREEYFKQVERL